MSGGVDLPYLIRRARRQFPQTLAVEDRRRARTLDELVDRAERFANALDGVGVEPGCSVGVLSENRLEYPEVDVGLALGRRVRVALNARLHVDDFKRALDDAGATTLVHSATFAAAANTLQEELGLRTIGLDDHTDGASFSYEKMLSGASATPVLRAGDEEEPAWITYTSGTTGMPKGVVLSHRAIREVALNILLELGPHEPGRRMVLTQALSHGAGYFVVSQLLAGGGVYIMERFDPEEAIAASRLPGVDTLKLVPAMLQPLIECAQGRDVDYETMVYGASPVPGPVLAQALERFGPVLIQIYGQSEAPVTLTCLHKQDHLGDGERLQSAGRPWRSVGVEVRDPDGRIVAVDEVGEVTIRGPHMMSGYRGRPEETRRTLRDGWIWTKDLGRKDAAGYVHLLGRSDEIINSGGYNIAPREVEMVLEADPAVRQCVVLGAADPRWGTAVNAVVCLSPGTSVGEQELIARVRPLLSFRTPKRIVFVEEIPMTPYGKADRPSLLARLQEAGAAGSDGAAISDGAHRSDGAA